MFSSKSVARHRLLEVLCMFGEPSRITHDPLRSELFFFLHISGMLKLLTKTFQWLKEDSENVHFLPASGEELESF